VEIEVCINKNGKFFIRHNVYWWIIHGKKNPDPVANLVVENMRNIAEKLPTIKWSGYNFRFENIIFEEDDLEVESILLPLNMFEDLIKNQVKLGEKIIEEIRSGEYKSKSDDGLNIKIRVWLQSNSLNSLLPAKSN